MESRGFFDEDERKAKLSRLGDNLEKISGIDFEMFRAELEKATRAENRGLGGRPAYDSVLMFKILILQRLYNLSDAETEFQINDRITFMRFLGLDLSDTVPDANTIWLFREKMTKAGLGKTLFDLFERKLEEERLVTHTGTIVDATFVEVPKQRNHREENKVIKEGGIPADWLAKEGDSEEEAQKKKHKLSQKDTEARWTKKRGETHFGYKSNDSVDKESKLVTNYKTTAASVHDSNVCGELLSEKDSELYADSAYNGPNVKAKLPASVKKVHICKKGQRNAPLTERDKKYNRLVSKTRSRIEHVFGFMTGSMGGLKLNCIGFDRADFQIGLINLAYNMCRYLYLTRAVKAS